MLNFRHKVLNVALTISRFANPLASASLPDLPKKPVVSAKHDETKKYVSVYSDQEIKLRELFETRSNETRNIYSIRVGSTKFQNLILNETDFSILQEGSVPPYLKDLYSKSAGEIADKTIDSTLDKAFDIVESKKSLEESDYLKIFKHFNTIKQLVSRKVTTNLSLGLKTPVESFALSEDQEKNFLR